MRAVLFRLALEVRLGNVFVLAFCLLNNHFHFVLMRGKVPLGDVMRRVFSPHAQKFNRRRGQDGAVLKGRFTALPVKNELYLLILLAYVEQNAVEAGIVPHAALWKASSAFRNYQGRPAPWMHRDFLAEIFGVPKHASPELWRAGYERVLGIALDAEERELVESRVRVLNMRGARAPDQMAKGAVSFAESETARDRCPADLDRGLSICTASALRRALRQMRARYGEWTSGDCGARSLDFWKLCEIALLRSAVGWSTSEIAADFGVSVSFVNRQRRRYAAEMEDREFRRRSEELHILASDESLAFGKKRLWRPGDPQ